MAGMNFDLDEHEKVLAQFRELRRTKVGPRALQHDKEASFPIENFQDMHAAGLLGLSVQKAYGGYGAGLSSNFLLEIAVVEELSKGCSSTGQAFHNHNASLEVIYVLGSQEQQSRFCTDVVRNGSIHGVWASERAGKTVHDIKTRATKVKGGYVVNGQKFFSTNSGGATWFQVWACVEGKSLEEGMLPCMIRCDDAGVSVLKDWMPLGQRGTTSGTTCYENVFVPLSNVVGEPGDYYKLLLFGPYFQLGWTAVYVGIGAGALEACLDYVKTKTRPWGETAYERGVDDPYIQNRVADLSVQVEASRLLLYRAARMLEEAARHPELRAEAAVAVYRAKVFATESALDVTSRIFQISGARAAVDAPQSGFDMYWRNARTFTLHDPVDYRRQRIGRYLLGVEDPPISWW
ncbi:MAG TPA: acyl-CoA dehydrogenase family protein [Candidatus Binataceae bacterium]|nr:acyl-CoA dehydrogenase family protein [Candidatus Binataceae bacterium]